LAINEGNSPHRYARHHTKANLQRRFAVQAKFRSDILPSLTMGTSSERARRARLVTVAEATDPRLPARVGETRDVQTRVCIPDAPLRTTHQNYLSELLIAKNLVLSFEPNPFAAAITASAKPAAIRPQLMAIASVPSFKTWEIMFTASHSVILSKQPFWIDNVRILSQRQLMDSA
jgi:hypothetical protein